MSLQLQKLKRAHPEIIEQWYRDSDGWWIDLHRGWVSTWSETHAIHADTVAEAVAEFRHVEPCRCADCAGG